MDQSISLNKFISDTGYCSRREADELIKAGRVLLNDVTAEPGNRYSPGDVVEVDGSLVTADKKEKKVYIAFNKPLGITTTSEEHIAGNIISYINFPKRIFPIGRLDKDSEGLIFLTNDGDIVNKLLRAGNAHEKEYLVRVHKPLEPGFADKMSSSIPILDTVTIPGKVQVTGRQSFRLILTQGLNRQIRRMCEYLGYTVVSLQRTRIMNVRLDKLATGKWRYLSEPEISALKDSIKQSSGTAPEKTRAGKPIVSKSFRTAKKQATGEKPVAFNRTPNQKKAGKASLKSDSRTGSKDRKNGSRSSARANSQPAGKPAPKSAGVKSASTKTSKKARTRPAKPATEKKPIGKYKAFRNKGKSAR